MKISYMAFMEDSTVSELYLRAIFTSYLQLRRGEDDWKDPYDLLFKDVLVGKANLKCVIWFHNRRVLENELGYPKTDYANLQDQFVKRELEKIFKMN